jgi:hypothetical protein
VVQQDEEGLVWVPFMSASNQDVGRMRVAVGKTGRKDLIQERRRRRRRRRREEREKDKGENMSWYVYLFIYLFILSYVL